MATDHAAQPSDGAQPQEERPRLPADAPEAVENTGEAHDLTYIRTRRARANDPRRSLNADRRQDPPGPIALRRAAPPPASVTAPGTRFFHRSRAFWLLSLALFALVAGITFALFYARQAWVKRAGVAPEIIHASRTVSSLHMHVEVQGERVLVSWNPLASGVEPAGGRLTIEDAGQRHEFSLDATQAANGSVLYRPTSGNVNFRLEIRNASGAVFSDNLRVLDPAQAALRAQKKALPSVAPPKSHKPRIQSASAPRRKPPVQHVARAIPPRRFETPHFTADPMEMPAAAPTVLSPGQAVAGSGNSLGPDILQRAPISDAPPSPASGRTAGELVGTVSALHDRDAPPPAGLFRPPQAVKQVMPKLRSSLVGVVVPGTKVEVQVRIDKHGRVKRARIAPASREIDIGVQKAALDAARQWRFTPAWKDGKRVPSEHTIVFRF
ncbi:MAG TPA: TonB family protein [Bryobacteraceae bacterium]